MHLLGGIDPLVVLDRRKWIVEMMEESLPSLILGRRPEAYRMVLETGPSHEKEVTAPSFDAALQLECDEARHGGNNTFGFAKRRLESAFLTRSHVQYRRLQDHRCLLCRAATCRATA